MRVREPEIAVHEEDRDGDGNGRHHPGREDEEEKIVGKRDLEPAERIGRERAEEDRQERRAEADDHRIQEPLAELRRTNDHHVVLADDLVSPGLRRVGGEEVFGLARPGRKEVHVAFEGRFENDLRRVGDRVGGRLEPGEPDPDQRDHGDDGVEDDKAARDPLCTRGRLVDGVCAHGCLRTACRGQRPSLGGALRDKWSAWFMVRSTSARSFA